MAPATACGLTRRQKPKREGGPAIGDQAGGFFSMIWKRLRRTREPGSQTWQRIDKTPVPLSAGRIWLVDKDGNITRAIGWLPIESQL